MNTKQLVSCLSLILTTSITLPTHADVSIEYKHGSKLKATDNYVKIIDRENIVITNMEEETVSIYSKDDDYYYTMSFNDMCNSVKKTQELLGLGNILNNLPSEQRDILAGIIPVIPQHQDKIEIINLGASGSILGYNVTKYQIMVNNEVKEVSWITTDSKVKDEFKHFYDQDIYNCLSINDKHYTSSEQYKNLVKIGFSLKTYLDTAAMDESNNTFSDNNYDQEDVKIVQSINFDSINNTEFEVPSGYKQTTFEEQVKNFLPTPATH
ncbi:MAG: hypothetical protein V5788_02475 [Shewanella sp.]